MTVLIVTHSEDNECIERVTDALHAKGARTFRLDTDRFPTELSLVLQDEPAGTGRHRLRGPEGTLELSEVSAVWYRRFNAGKRIPTSMDEQLRRASREESRRVLLGMLASLDVFQLDPLQAVRRADHKQLQLQVARALGLKTPRTLITNEPEAVRAFAASCPQGLVTKMLSSFAVYEEGEEKVVFTNPVRPEDLEDLDGLALCPMTFQEAVPKQRELRVTVVGTRAFAASIDSQALERSRHDWRREGEALLDAWEPYTLPADVEARLLALHARLGLHYGACDFILTPSGEHVFLEVNPVGEFFWLERTPGLPLSEAIAEVLLGSGRRG